MLIGFGISSLGSRKVTNRRVVILPNVQTTAARLIPLGLVVVL